MEDQLTHEERVRLEALAQAVALCSVGSKEGVKRWAPLFENWILHGRFELDAES